jgi:hypothetical protein
MECFQTNISAKIIEQSLLTAGVTKQMSKKVMDAVNESTWTDGKVMMVQTNANDRDIYVGGQSAMTVFKFPLNQANFENELMRAQETHRGVTVVYTINAKKEKIITSVMLYGKGAYSE